MNTVVIAVLLFIVCGVWSHGESHDECDANPCGDQECKDLYQSEESRSDFVCICKSNENRKRVGGRVEDCLVGHSKSDFDAKLGAPMLLAVALVAAVLIYSRMSSRKQDAREKNERYGSGSPNTEATIATTATQS